MITTIVGARWLGHGRATEFMLSLIALLYGIILLFSGAAGESVATWDLALWGYGHWIAVPFIVKAVLSGSGLVGNLRGWPFSATLRFSGAFLGSVLWAWYLVKLLLFGAIGSLGFSFCVIAAIMSIRIMAMSRANLPLPGAPGAV